MEIPTFSGDEDKDGINPMDWLRVINEIDLSSIRAGCYLEGEDEKWLKIHNVNTILNPTWEEFE